MKLTIAIPTFNRAENLNVLLKSFQPDEFGGQAEVMVVDNCSSDQTEEIVNGYTRFPIVYKRNKFNVGMEGNIINAMILGSGEYVWLVSDHMQVLKNSVARILDVINKHSFEIGYAGINDYGKLNITEGVPVEWGSISPKDIGTALFCVSNISGAIFQKKFAEKRIRKIYKYATYSYPHLALFSEKNARFVYVSNCSLFNRERAGIKSEYDSLKTRFAEFNTAVSSFSLGSRSAIARSVCAHPAYWSALSDELVCYVKATKPHTKHIYNTLYSVFASNSWRVRCLIAFAIAARIVSVLTGVKVGFFLYRAGRRLSGTLLT